MDEFEALLDANRLGVERWVKLGTVICAALNGFLIGRCTAWMDGRFQYRDALPWRKYFS